MLQDLLIPILNPKRKAARHASMAGGEFILIFCFWYLAFLKPLLF
jgi:hypothetical protein